MSTKIKYTFLIVLFLATTSAFAQYGYGRGSNPGVDRSIGRVPKAAKAKDKDKKDVDMVAVTVKYIDKRLNLDDFQEAAITTVYNEYKADVMLIAGADEPEAVKRARMKEITEVIDGKLMKYLSDKQVEEYKKMIAERKD